MVTKLEISKTEESQQTEESHTCSCLPSLPWEAAVIPVLESCLQDVNYCT